MADLLSPEKENDIYQSPAKVIFLLIFEVGSAFLMSFYFRQLIVDPTTGGLILFLTGLALFLIFSFFASLLVKGLIWSRLGAALAVIASLAVFYDYFSSTLIVSGLVIFLIFLWAVNELRSTAEDSLKIRFFHLAKVFLTKITLGLAVMLTIFCYFLLPVDGFPLSFKNFQFLLKPNEKLVAVFIPNFRFEKSLSVGFEEINFLGLEIKVEEPVDKIIFDVLKTKFDQMSAGAKKLTVIGVFVSLFLFIEFVFIPLKWIFPIILFLIYLFLSAVNFVSVSLESRSKETLSI